MNVKGFIFDLDGTLLDSMGIWDNIGQEYLQSQGIRGIPCNLKEILSPMSLAQAAAYFIADYGLPKTPEQIMAEFSSILADHYKYRVSLKDGVSDFLVRNRHCKMCIATATDKGLAAYALKRLGVYQYFDFILTLDEVGGSKLEPAIYLRAAQRLDLPVGEIAVFEDAPHAIETAKKAGFYTVGVYERAFESEQENIKKTADRYIRSFSAL